MFIHCISSVDFTGQINTRASDFHSNLQQKRPVTMNLFVALFLTFVPLTMGIYNGIPAIPNEQPSEFGFVVQLQRITYHKTSVYNCGGSIVAPNIVVTAAHCVLEIQEDVESQAPTSRIVVKVIAGESRFGHEEGTTTQVRLAKKIIVHEKYSGKPHHRNDIALLVLTNPLKFDQFVYQIQIPKQGQEFDGYGVIAGYGGTERGIYSKILLKGQVKILSREDCLDDFADYLLEHRRSELEAMAALNEIQPDEDDTEDEEDDTYICGRDCTGTRVCKGDSGGPVICQVGKETFLCGIISSKYEENCEEPLASMPVHAPDVYVAVANFSDWINAAIAEFNTTCRSTEFDCGDGTCIPDQAKCDRKLDCPLGTDEIGCYPCGPNQFFCSNKFKCIDAAYVCDNTNDCGDDASDEIGCEECTLDQFRCTTGTCIEKALVCDGVQHCEDASDEFGCGECSGSEFQCQNKMCVPRDKVCDGSYTCLDGSDELACGDCPIESYGPNCTDGLSFDDIDDKLTCNRGLNFASCISRGCLFNKDTRECFPHASFVYYLNMSAVANNFPVWKQSWDPNLILILILVFVLGLGSDSAYTGLKYKLQQFRGREARGNQQQQPRARV